MEALAPAPVATALARLSSMIVALELAPGALVSEGQLVRMLGCPPAEVRDAIPELRESGLITVVPRAGIVIAEVSIADVQQVIEARMAVEGYCARLAAVRASPREIEELRRLSDAVAARSLDVDDWQMSYVDMDRGVHDYVAQIAGNPTLARVLGRLLLANARIWNVFHLRARGVTLHVSHDDTVEAIARHDPDGAEESVRRHVSLASRMLGEAFDPLPGIRQPADPAIR